MLRKEVRRRLRRREIRTRLVAGVTAIAIGLGLAVGGTAAQMMRSCYETAGVAPDEGFHDLPDHAAIQIEFLARLMERGARGDADGAAMATEFATEFVHAWAGPLERACAAAVARHPAAAVYAALARLLRRTLNDPSLQRD